MLQNLVDDCVYIQEQRHSFQMVRRLKKDRKILQNKYKWLFVSFSSDIYMVADCSNQEAREVLTVLQHNVFQRLILVCSMFISENRDMHIAVL